MHIYQRLEISIAFLKTIQYNKEQEYTTPLLKLLGFVEISMVELLQLLMIALAVGTPLAVAIWFLVAMIYWLIMPVYAKMSTDSEAVIKDVIVYGRIVCVFSFGLLLGLLQILLLTHC